MAHSFHKTHIDLGVIKVGVQQTIHFPYENVKKIVKTVSSCDCSVPSSTSSEIIVKFTPKEIPVHLKLKGQTELQVTKQINVQYITLNGEEKGVNLSFSGLVKE